MTFISRRDLLKRAAVVGAAAVPANAGRPFQGRHDEPDDEPERLALRETALHGEAMAPREPLENLTAAEADLVEAIVARLITSTALSAARSRLPARRTRRVLRRSTSTRARRAANRSPSCPRRTRIR